MLDCSTAAQVLSLNAFQYSCTHSSPEDTFTVRVIHVESRPSLLSQITGVGTGRNRWWLDLVGDLYLQEYDAVCMPLCLQ